MLELLRLLLIALLLELLRLLLITLLLELLRLLIALLECLVNKSTLLRIHLLIVHSAHIHSAVHRAAAAQSHNDLVCFLLVPSVFVGIAAVGTVFGQLELDLAEIRRIDVDINRDLILVFITRRIVGYVSAFGILLIDLRAVLFDLISDVGNFA